MVSVLVPPAVIGDGENALDKLTELTVIFAVAEAELVAPCVVLKASAGMVLVTVVVEVFRGAVTVTVIVHVPLLAGIVPPLKLTMFGAVVEAVPPAQVVAAVPFTAVKGLGNVSERPGDGRGPATVKAVAVGLCNVIVRVVVPPAAIFPLNALVTLADVIVKLAVGVLVFEINWAVVKSPG